MSSVQVLDPPPLKPGGGPPQKQPGRPSNNNNNNNGANNSKRKNKHDRGSRKRSKSFSGGGGLMISQKPVLPSKFLLGGNIKDPLNLNSLQDEEINRAMNAVTPKSSPVPTPPRKKCQIEVIIPKNIHDPLNLIDCADDAEYEQQLSSSIKKSKKKRLKKRRTISGTMDATAESADLSACSEAKTPETSYDSAKIPDAPPFEAATPVARAPPAATAPAALDAAAPSKAGGKRKAPPKPKAVHELSLELEPGKREGAAGAKAGKRKSDEHGHGAKKFKNNAMDKIVSPVVPQPGAWLKRSASLSNKRAKPRQNRQEGEAKEPQFKEKDKRFQYGNYNRYYGYRNPNNEIDHRLRVFSHHPYLFDNKDVLDIGCNIGHITHSVARDFRAKTVLGIDIDPKLISIARKNIRHYVKTSEESPLRGGGGGGAADEGVQTGSKKSSEFFPISMPILYGAIDVPGYHDSERKVRGFPNNVTFKACNYILEDDNLIALEQPQFDVILCLSISKWIHLNWGDAGMKQAFRRMYAQLRPGGKLILEPQNWASYKSKKKLTDTIYKNYSAIEFFPDKFREYLLSPAVGFAKGEILGYPPHQAKGFRRPVQVFTKSTMFPSERIEAATPVNFTPSDVTPSVASLDSFPGKAEKYESQIGVSHVYTNIFVDRFCVVSGDKSKDDSSADLRPTDSERTIASEEGEDSIRTGEDSMGIGEDSMGTGDNLMGTGDDLMRTAVDSEMSESGSQENTPEAGDNT